MLVRLPSLVASRPIRRPLEEHAPGASARGDLVQVIVGGGVHGLVDLLAQAAAGGIVHGPILVQFRAVGHLNQRCFRELIRLVAKLPWSMRTTPAPTRASSTRRALG